MSTWHEDAAFWDAVGEVLFGTSRMQAAPNQVQQVLALTGATPPGAVLDMPCGIGRHAVAFAERGFTVTGVDRTTSYLDRAAAAARRAGVRIETVADDMRTFRRHGAFDLAVSLFSSFGYFDDEADDLAVLQGYRDALKPGGILLLEMMGKEVLARDFRPRDWQVMESGTRVLEHRVVSQDWTWLENRWTVLRGGEVVEASFAMRLYGASDLRRALAAAGFARVDFFGDLDGAPYDHEARRLVAVARRD